MKGHSSIVGLVLLPFDSEESVSSVLVFFAEMIFTNMSKLKDTADVDFSQNGLVFWRAVEKKSKILRNRLKVLTLLMKWVLNCAA